jgi:PAS domain S-box-containing protein
LPPARKKQKHVSAAILNLNPGAKHPVWWQESSTDQGLSRMTLPADPTGHRRKQLVQELRRERRHRKQAECDLHRCREYRRTLLRYMDDVAFIAARDGGLLEISASAERMFGRKPEEFLGTSLGNFFRREDQKTRFLEQLQRESRVENFEFESREFSGRIRFCVINAAVDTKGKVDGHADTVSGVIRNAAPFGRSENELSESREQLHQSQKMEALGTLVAGVAHEINNPINLIMYNLPLLQKIWRDLLPVIQRGAEDRKASYGGLTVAFLEQNLEQMLSDTFMAANRVTKIISDLKNFARRSSVSDKQPIEVNDAVRNAMRLVRTTLRNSGIQAEIRLGESLPLMKGNLQNIEQILLNIIINAAQSIDHAQGRIRIETGLSKTDGRLCITIADNGKGIAPNMVERLFDPFVTDKQAEGGTGLGLAVSYSLIKAHGGEIRFDSREKEGTTFRLFFPTVGAGKRARILVVDDDPSIRQLLTRTLTRQRSYLVEEAVNGIEACIKLGTYRPAVVVLDVFMPDMDGVEVCRAIRRDSELSGLRVVVTTGHPQDPKLREVRRMGFTNILAKPFEIGEFLELIDTVLTV